MNARHGCWTIPQLLLDLEARVKALEENQKVYVHHVLFAAVSFGILTINIINGTDESFTPETLTEYLHNIPENSALMCTGDTSSGKAITMVKYSESDGMYGVDSSNTAHQFEEIRIYSDYVEPIRS